MLMLNPSWSRSTSSVNNFQPCNSCLYHQHIPWAKEDPKLKYQDTRDSTLHVRTGSISPPKQNLQNTFRHMLMRELNTSHLIQWFLMELHWIQNLHFTVSIMIPTYSISHGSKLLKTLQQTGITVQFSLIYSSFLNTNSYLVLRSFRTIIPTGFNHADFTKSIFNQNLTY